MQLRIGLLATAFAAIVMVLPGAASAQSKVKTLGRYGDWAGYTYEENGSPVCYAASTPVQSTGKVADRSDILFLVTHRPDVEDIGVVTVVSGYTFKKDSAASVKIGGNTFSFFTRDGNAWANGKDDAKVVSAMQRGATMLIRGKSAQGTETSDQYSLMGFTKAYTEISAACRVKTR